MYSCNENRHKNQKENEHSEVYDLAMTMAFQVYVYVQTHNIAYAKCEHVFVRVLFHKAIFKNKRRRNGGGDKWQQKTPRAEGELFKLGAVNRRNLQSL